MYVVGLTGGIGTGKSTVTGIFKSRGAHVVDADLIAREVVRKGERAFREIVDHFGQSVVASDGELNRKELSRVVFSDEKERKYLNAVTHRQIFLWMVRDLLREWWKGSPDIIVVDAPLLLEASRFTGLVSDIVVVAASEETQLKRIALRNPEMTSEAAKSRIASQMPIEEKRRRAQRVIENDGTLPELERKAEDTWGWIVQRAKSQRECASRRRLLVSVASVGVFGVLSAFWLLRGRP